MKYVRSGNFTKKTKNLNKMKTKFRLPKKVRLLLYAMLLICNFCFAQFELSDTSRIDFSDVTISQCMVLNKSADMVVTYFPSQIYKPEIDSSKGFGNDALITAKLIIKYAKECYNDSTKVIYGVYYNFKGETFKGVYEYNPHGHVANLLRTELGYVHREPTLFDFVKWLKEKYDL